MATALARAAIGVGAGPARRLWGDLRAGRAAVLDVGKPPIADAALGAVGFLLARISGDGADAPLVHPRPRADAGGGADARVAPNRLRPGPRGDLRGATDALRLHGAAHVLPEPGAACGDASCWPVPDRPRLARRNAEARHAALGAPGGRGARGRCRDPPPAAAGAGHGSVRSGCSISGSSACSFPRDARRGSTR